MADFAKLYREWKAPLGGVCPDWPAKGWAVEGDFVGIQKFVLRPVPGAKGAARRLRGRSLLVVAYSQLIAKAVEEATGGRTFYLAGGRFLVATSRQEQIPEKLAALQSRIDAWALGVFRGEVEFHLAWARIEDGRIPRTVLRERMLASRARPLAGVLRSGDDWNLSSFYRLPAPNAIRCPSCLSTGSPEGSDDEHEICLDCVRDRDLGGQLAHLTTPSIAAAADGPIDCLGKRYAIGQQGDRIQVVRHMPRQNQQPMTLEEVAERSCGSRKWLGYLRLDADRIGMEFEKLEGSPGNVRGLSRLLHHFFWEEVQALVESKYPMIYPVYGGGDDLFVIGPWDQALDFAGVLAARFHAISQGNLRFSCGVALSKAKQHILSKSEEAEAALHQAKVEGGNRIRALSAGLTWQDYAGALKQAKLVAEWHNQKGLASAFLHQLIELHLRWQKDMSDAGYRPLLHYQIERNIRGKIAPEIQNWARSLLKPGSQWPMIGFICRYAMLGSTTNPKGDED